MMRAVKIDDAAGLDPGSSRLRQGGFVVTRNGLMRHDNVVRTMQGCKEPGPELLDETQVDVSAGLNGQCD